MTPHDARDTQLRQRQIAGLLLLALFVLIVSVLRAHHGELLPPSWWRW
ncbi:MAG: hypothetical protein JWM54_1731 [Acidobacteriaceae bacterium]|nr:hypothetical protein [Acidobacteriaceae bacterium]